MTGMISSLEELFDKQRALMTILGIDSQSGKIANGGQPSTEELGAAIGITVESAEILEQIEKANRVWKNFDGSLFDNVKEELTDVLFFVLELAILLNLTGEQLAESYNAKYKKNLLRVLEATAKKGSGVSSLLTKAMDEEFGYKKTEELIKEVLSKKEA